MLILKLVDAMYITYLDLCSLLDYETGKDVVTQLLPSPGHVNPMTLQQSGESQTHPPVVYNFHYHGNSHLQTEAKHSMRCPWCSVDCGYLYSLLCHLTLCHPRLTSVYTVSITTLCVYVCVHACVCVIRMCIIHVICISTFIL